MRDVPRSPSLHYQPFYCEENIFHLARDARFAGRDPSAVFILGGERGCGMWKQRAAGSGDGLVVWDYHVVLLLRTPWEIWDLDTLLGCPVAASTYLDESFRPAVTAAPKLRVVSATDLASTFASDRSHMRNANGTFQHAPPPWPPIERAGGASTLRRFLDPEDRIAGDVIELAELARRVGGALGAVSPERAP